MIDPLIGSTTAVFSIALSVALLEPVDVGWSTKDGTAKAGTDYEAASGVVTFLPGETSKQIEVTVYGQDVGATLPKNFYIKLTPPTNAILNTPLVKCVITVEDDQGTPITSLIVAQGKRGLKGDPGLSAYEQAVIMGYTGTIEDWMNDIANASHAADRAEDALTKVEANAAKAEAAASAAAFAGRIFQTTAAGVDPITGVPNGYYYNVRSASGDAYIDEYQNVNGVPTATGKSYPTSSFVQEMSEYVPLPYKNGATYELHDRVTLANGDIVRSTVVENTNNPNSNMTGWMLENSASNIKFANGKSAQSVKDRFVHIDDFGGSHNDFDPSAAEANAKTEANPNAKPYVGARQTALPMQTLKVWNYCDGYLDRGAVASIRNVSAFDSAEPRTEILGISDASGLGQYADRDVVGLYVQADGQPALHTSTATSFTATTVTCSDMSTTVKNSLRKKQIIDVLDGAVKYSGLISSVSNDTITIDTAWYKTGGGTGTPTNGSQVKLVPNTKVWATNFNVMLKPESDAESMVGIELGTFNNKYPNGAGYGYDIWSGGQYRIGAAFQARGQYTTGLYLYDRCDTGTIVSNPNVGHLVIGEGRADTYGVLSHRMAISFLSRGATTYGYAQVTESGDFLTGINPDGAWQSLKYTSAVINSPATIDQNAVVVFINPNAQGMVVDLPTPSNNPRRVIYAKNLSSTNTVYLGGAVESGTGSYQLQPKETVQLFCDGNTWFPIAGHQG